MNYLKSVLFLCMFSISYCMQGAEAAAKELGIALKEETTKITAHPLGQVVVESAAQGTLLQRLPTELRAILSNYVMAARSPEEMVGNMRRFLEAPGFAGLIPLTVRTAAEKFKIPEAAIVALLDSPAAHAWFLDELRLVPELKAQTLEWIKKYLTRPTREKPGTLSNETKLFSAILLDGAIKSEEIIINDYLAQNNIFRALANTTNPMLEFEFFNRARIFLEAENPLKTDQNLVGTLKDILEANYNQGYKTDFLRLVLEKNSHLPIQDQFKIAPLTEILLRHKPLEIFYKDKDAYIREVSSIQMTLLQEYQQK